MQVGHNFMHLSNRGAKLLYKTEILVNDFPEWFAGFMGNQTQTRAQETHKHNNFH